MLISSGFGNIKYNHTDLQQYKSFFHTMQLMRHLEVTDGETPGNKLRYKNTRLIEEHKMQSFARGNWLQVVVK